MSWRRISGALALAATLAALAPGQATALLPAQSPMPPAGRLFLGVNDKGGSNSVTGVKAFTELTGRHPAILHTFVRWMGHFKANNPLRHWQETQTRPMLHLDTKKEGSGEVISPKDIALGKGDEYLLGINEFFASRNLPAFIRPLGEPNRCENVWSTYTCNQKLRDGNHTQAWYIQAFRRIYTIVHGGATIQQLNAKLAAIKLPAVQSGLPVTATLPSPPVAVVWSTLTAGSPRMTGNYPGNFWPGEEWVDLVAPDFYDNQDFKDLDHLYSMDYLHGEPFGLAEWGVTKNNPEFAKKVIRWALQRRWRMRMLVYYVGYKKEEAFNLESYKPTAEVVKREFSKSPDLLAFAHPNAGDPLPSPSIP